MDFKVADKNGSWLISSARFPFVDPESNTRFEPGVATKATVTDWVKTQKEAGWLAETADPMADPAKEEAKKDEPAKK